MINIIRKLRAGCPPELAKAEAMDKRRLDGWQSYGWQANFFKDGQR
jgi:hypothetical protein